ncbi:hypothetical protein [Photobacterium kishitanii]|nr:hypothetical protein [Photobacterium kishitanii]
MKVTHKITIVTVIALIFTVTATCLYSTIADKDQNNNQNNHLSLNENDRPREGCDLFMGDINSGYAKTNRRILMNIDFCKALKMKTIEVPQDLDNCIIFNYLKTSSGYINGTETKLNGYCDGVVKPFKTPSFTLV